MATGQYLMSFFLYVFKLHTCIYSEVNKTTCVLVADSSRNQGGSLSPQTAHNKSRTKAPSCGLK